MKDTNGNVNFEDILNWIPAKIGDICDPINGKAFKSSEWKKEGLPIIRIKNLKDSEAPFNFFQGQLDEKFKVYDGDLLFAWSGTPGTSFGAHIWKGKTAALNQHIFNINFNNKLINPKFFCFALNHNVARYIEQAQGGVGLAHITKSKFTSSCIHLPPLKEQNRIVSKIEELFTILDSGIYSLKQVQVLLKRYRQSVLKSAVEGKLTSEWRKQHKDELEPADKLLERILIERKEKWEAEQLANFKEKGKKPPKNWQNKYKEPTPPDTSDLHELPDGWVWVKIDQISFNVRYGSSSKTSLDADGVPVLRMGNIVDGRLIFDSLKYLPKNHDEFPDLFLESGDLLFNRTNSKELVGKTAVFAGYSTPCSFASYLIRVRLCDTIEPNFFGFFINSSHGRAWINSVVSQQVGQANVNGTKLKNLAVPLPSAGEQTIIAKEVERIFSIIDESNKLVESELKRSNSLRQAILKKAFEGKLVPQDLNDEPASVLLERIKAEKSKLKN